MSINAGMFFTEAQKIIDQLHKKEMENIKQAAAVMADSIASDGVVHIFGPGHSKAFAIELAYRAGGLVPMNAVLLDDLVMRGNLPFEELNNPNTERNPQNSHNLLDLHDLRKQDAFIICSNSGINGSVVEIALEVKRRQLPLIAVTSLDHSM